METNRRQFVTFCMEQLGLKLDYTYQSLYDLDTVADNVDIDSDNMKFIEDGMSQYLSTTLIRISGGKLSVGHFGDCIEINGIEVYPSAWVSKRLRRGPEESIRLKIKALWSNLDSQSLSTWSPLWEEDELPALKLADNLKPSYSQRRWVDEWILRYLVNRKRRETPNFGRIDPDVPVYCTDMLDQQANKYFWARLVKLYDCIYGYKFGSKLDYTGEEINVQIKSAQDSMGRFTEEEYAAFVDYLEGACISPNSGIFNFIWSCAKKSGVFSDKTSPWKTRTIIGLLELNAVRLFHHDINDFKKIMNLIDKTDESVLDFLRRYEVKNNQSCYTLISYILQSTQTNINNKALIIEWLDTRISSKKWDDRLKAILSRIHKRDLLGICNWIEIHPELCVAHVGDMQWPDEVSRRFLSSVSRWKAYEN